jgi:hypothetical protein
MAIKALLESGVEPFLEEVRVEFGRRPRLLQAATLSLPHCLSPLVDHAATLVWRSFLSG